MTSLSCHLALLASATFALGWSPPQEVEDAAAVSHWAVLVAGSSGYGNYRHQSDVCHAYQIMLQVALYGPA
eukprot:scaffold120320_cov33-Tisochrysis_lutea.AAC.4